MKKNSPSKRLLSLLLCLALFLSLGVSSFAEARMESAPAVEERGTFKPAELRTGLPPGRKSRRPRRSQMNRRQTMRCSYISSTILPAHIPSTAR